MFGKRRRPEDFRQEVEAHLELEEAQLRERGLAPDEARRAARRKFGNVTSAQERFYERGRWLWLDGLVQDVRFAGRSVARYPTASLVIVISLAAGIACMAGMLTIRDAVFWNPPPLYERPEELSLVHASTPERPRGGIPGGLLRAWSDDAVAVRMNAASAYQVVEVRASDRRETVRLQQVTPDLFPMLGVHAALGRTFAADGRFDSSSVVLSHRLWELLFQQSPDAIGALVFIDGQGHNVIGVMPSRFSVSDFALLWTPLDVGALRITDRLDVIARRNPKQNHAELESVLGGASAEFVRGLPAAERSMRVTATPAIGTELGRQVGLLVVGLFGLSALLTLLIACANTAVLMIALWTRREREMAIRASIGAGRRRLVRLLLVESTVLAVLGGLLGICATVVFRDLLVARLPVAGMFNLSIHPGLVLKVGLIALAAGIVSGMLPALYESRELQIHPLRGIRADRQRQRLRHTLVVAEIAVTVALLVVTGVLFDAHRRNVSMDYGFPADQLLAARVENPLGFDPEAIRRQLGTIPGVVRVTAADAIPLFSSGLQKTVRLESDPAVSIRAEVARVDDDYFTAVDSRIVRGRPFASSDLGSGLPVAILSESLARRILPNAEPVGAVVQVDDSRIEIVGVSRDSITTFLGRPRLRLFVPRVHTDRPTALGFLLRSAADSRDLARAVRSRIRTAGPDYRLGQVTTLRGVIEASSEEILVTTYPMLIVIAMGMGLSAVGIYSVLSFSVARRSRELAVRIAVGASWKDVATVVATHSLRLVAIGSALGVLATFGLTRLAQGAGGVFDSPGWEAFVLPVVVLVTVGVFATWVPLRRATSINPSVLLRTD